MSARNRKNAPVAAVSALNTGAPGLPARIAAKGWPYLFITGLVAIMYWPVLSAKGWLWNDFPEQNFVYRLFAAVSLKQGEFPFWNPYVFSGMPFFADVQAAILYPLNLLLTPFASAGWLDPLLVEYQIVFHVALAGAFMFLLCRDLGIVRVAALLAAITFMFCGFFTAHIFHTNLVLTAAWFPLVVLLYRRMVEQKSLLYLALCAMTLSVAFLAGYPQTMVHLYYWLAAWLVFFLFTGRSKSAAAPWQNRGVRLLLFTVMAALSIGMTAVQLLPTSELGQQSSRPSMEFREACEGSFYPYRFVTMLVPDFFGTPNEAYWGIGANDERAGVHNYWETVAYCGIAPLFLALFATVFVRTRMSLFLSVMGAIAFLLSLGDSFFLFKVAHALLPGIDRFRVPGRFLFITSFSVALLAAMGLQALITNTWWRRDRYAARLPRISAGVAAASLLSAIAVSAGALKGAVAGFMLSSGVFGSDLAAIAGYVDKQIYPALGGACWLAAFFAAAAGTLLALRVAGKARASYAAWGFLALTAADLLIYGYGYAARPTDPNRMYEKSPVIRELQKQLETEYFRINSRDSKPGTDDLGGRHMLFQKNQGSVHRLFLMEGYNPLRLKHQIAQRGKNALDILNVKYAVRVDSATGAMGFALNPTCLPRARMVYDYEIARDAPHALDLVRSPAFDHARKIVLEQKPVLSPCVACDSVPWKATITRYGLNEIELDVETGRDGLLALSEIHYPAWKARLDGLDAPLYRADYALRAIPVPAGRHKVVCWYDAATFRTGRTVSLLSLVATLALLAAGIVRSRRRRLRPSAA